MREISSNTLSPVIASLIREANYKLSSEVKQAIVEASCKESSRLGRYIFKQMLENIDIAEKKRVPLCQDTGIQEIFVDIGENVHITGQIEKAINNGVRKGTREGFLRASIVKSPIFERTNTKDNTPAIIHYNSSPGDKIKITLISKGFGAENASEVKMLNPTEGAEGVKNFVLQVVKKNGPNACPPLFVGIGIGGSQSKVTLLAKEALLRPIIQPHPDRRISKFEDELLDEINSLGIGPQGVGGRVTALKVSISTFPTHIGGLPVCVNLSCYLLRYKSIVI